MPVLVAAVVSVPALVAAVVSVPLAALSVVLASARVPVLAIELAAESPLAPGRTVGLVLV